METHADTRLYVQMEPDKEAKSQLVAIGEALPRQKSGRLLPESELHVTLIHFGKTHDVLTNMRREVNIDDESYAHILNEYVTRTKSLMTDTEYDCAPLGYARFGARHTTLVGRYKAPHELVEIHKEAYAELMRFIEACGIKAADTFAAHDPNFMFAREFNPHITIYKGYDGHDPEYPLPSIALSFMPLVY